MTEHTEPLSGEQGARTPGLEARLVDDLGAHILLAANRPVLVVHGPWHGAFTTHEPAERLSWT